MAFRHFVFGAGISFVTALLVAGPAVSFAAALLLTSALTFTLIGLGSLMSNTPSPRVRVRAARSRSYAQPPSFLSNYFGVRSLFRSRPAVSSHRANAHVGTTIRPHRTGGPVLPRYTSSRVRPHTGPTNQQARHVGTRIRARR